MLPAMPPSILATWIPNDDFTVSKCGALLLSSFISIWLSTEYLNLKGKNVKRSRIEHAGLAPLNIACLDWRKKEIAIGFLVYLLLKQTNLNIVFLISTICFQDRWFDSKSKAEALSCWAGVVVTHRKMFPLSGTSNHVGLSVPLMGQKVER